jgi:hypothetical protein
MILLLFSNFSGHSGVLPVIAASVQSFRVALSVIPAKAGIQNIPSFSAMNDYFSSLNRTHNPYNFNYREAATNAKIKQAYS